MPINNTDANTWFTLHETASGAPIPLDVDQYPDGSFAFRAQTPYVSVTVTMKTTLPQAVFALFQIGALLPETRAHPDHIYHTLIIQTFPDQRADKQKKIGEVNASVVTAGVINRTVFTNLVVHDPHSGVFVDELRRLMKETSDDYYGTAALSSLTVISSLECFKRALARVHSRTPMQHDYVVAVDEGAISRAEHFAAHYGTGIIYAEKERNPEGQIIGHKIVSAKMPCGLPLTKTVLDCDVYVIDDLCDGGRTFISIAELLKATYVFDRLHLHVTHGLFSQGKNRLLMHYNTVQSLFDYSEQ